MDALRRHNNWCWSVLSGALAMAYSCVRFQHVQRSWPLLRTSITVRVGLIVEAEHGSVDACREVLQPLMADGLDAKVFTSYSFRRFAPTFCDIYIRGAPWHERLAMAGWSQVKLGAARCQVKLSAVQHC
eukprot:3938317-Amphidinium_carterae.1